MAKSEIRAVHVSQAIENLVCQGTGHHENDFASSIIFSESRLAARDLAGGIVRRLCAEPSSLGLFLANAVSYYQALVPMASSEGGTSRSTYVTTNGDAPGNVGAGCTSSPSHP